LPISIFERTGRVTVEAKRGSSLKGKMGESGKSVIPLRARVDIFIITSKRLNQAERHGATLDHQRGQIEPLDDGMKPYRGLLMDEPAWQRQEIK
jgi:hypothetical protein